VLSAEFFWVKVKNFFALQCTFEIRLNRKDDLTD
jgi:hypothetical protein